MCATLLHLYRSAQLSMPTMEKHYRNKTIIIIIITTKKVKGTKYPYRVTDD